jgi:Protein of unknown function (DUF1549)/Protein of unknown function (DUF1553)
VLPTRLLIAMAVVCGALANAAHSPLAGVDAITLAATLDRRLAEHWAAEGLEAAPPAEDSVFLRRVYLDLAGHIPPIHEARDFVDDRSPDKRSVLIERLLRSQDYARHFSHVWRTILLPSTIDIEKRRLVAPFDEWLRKRLQTNAGYDQIVRGILLSEKPDRDGASPEAFAEAMDNKPENWASTSARLFLGIKLECAQCHDHPHAPWTRRQFWEFAAFFGKDVTYPPTGTTVTPRTPVGDSPRLAAGVDSRSQLVRWLTSPANRGFARATVNRVWSYFFGRGLVEPIDEIENPTAAGQAEILEQLASQFTTHGYDLRFLIRTITTTRAYQRKSAVDPQAKAPLAHMPVRVLSPEQLFDSICLATGRRNPGSPLDLARQVDFATVRTQFLTSLGDGQSNAHTPTSILHALYLMNSKFISEATAADQSDVIASMAHASSSADMGNIQELFLNTLTRQPRPRETVQLLKYIEMGNRREQLADILWVLLNSSEFRFNH